MSHNLSEFVTIERNQGELNKKAKEVNDRLLGTVSNRRLWGDMLVTVNVQVIQSGGDYTVYIGDNPVGEFFENVVAGEDGLVTSVFQVYTRGKIKAVLFSSAESAVANIVARAVSTGDYE